MENLSISSQAREFLHRYKQLSENSGYNLVYDTIALLQEYVPHAQMSIIIGRPKNVDVMNVEIGTVPLWLATPFLAKTTDVFFSLLDRIDFAKQFLSKILANVLSDQPMQAYSFSDHLQHSKGLIHEFYKWIGVNDVLAVAGLLGKHQLVLSPCTESYYAAIFSVMHSNDQRFNEQDKALLALCVDFFIDDLKKKISNPEDSPFLPFLTGEAICAKTRVTDLFQTGKKFTPRELATIKACFDLKQQRRKITRPEVACYLYLDDQDSKTIAPAELKKATYKVDFDLKKIKQHLLNHINPDNPAYKITQDTFAIEHITDVFKIYAYFGLYPDQKNRYTSYLGDKLSKHK